VKRALVVACIALASCAPRPAARCDVDFAREISFTAAAAHDQVSVRATGPSCAEAIALYAVRENDGHLVWTWAGPLARMYEAPPDAHAAEGVETFLQRWAQPKIQRTSAAPAWQGLSPGQTTLDRLTYEDVRARDLPMLCHLSGVAREVCAFWEPAAGAAGLFLERNVEENRR
jgi:hypothetical protein